MVTREPHPVTDGSKSRHPLPITRPTSGNPVEERKEGLHEQAGVEHDVKIITREATETTNLLNRKREGVDCIGRGK